MYYNSMPQGLLMKFLLRMNNYNHLIEKLQYLEYQLL